MNHMINHEHVYKAQNLQSSSSVCNSSSGGSASGSGSGSTSSSSGNHELKVHAQQLRDINTKDHSILSDIESGSGITTSSSTNMNTVSASGMNNHNNSNHHHHNIMTNHANTVEIDMTDIKGDSVINIRPSVSNSELTNMLLQTIDSNTNNMADFDTNNMFTNSTDAQGRPQFINNYNMNLDMQELQRMSKLKSSHHHNHRHHTTTAPHMHTKLNPTHHVNNNTHMVSTSNTTTNSTSNNNNNKFTTTTHNNNNTHTHTHGNNNDLMKSTTTKQHQHRHEQHHNNHNTTNTTNNATKTHEINPSASSGSHSYKSSQSMNNLPPVVSSLYADSANANNDYTNFDWTDFLEEDNYYSSNMPLATNGTGANNTNNAVGGSATMNVMGPTTSTW